ncbi:hypothetical protein [Myxococcus virescens]|uniref:Uncharacterized protein n=1 Tax=Myxococcus virescens TaxID=83456 RepID=A0A511HPX4_9BACT|nr:hypothetical protein [Myxococcus virescens]GEL75643.1 hypothetical protein MVI01_74270 [Myxococcus virescens]SDF27603.1 hypothetical protein SAMN04488504_12752 [Myxococcus virescens]
MKTNRIISVPQTLGLGVPNRRAALLSEIEAHLPHPIRPGDYRVTIERLESPSDVPVFVDVEGALFRFPNQRAWARLLRHWVRRRHQGVPTGLLSRLAERVPIIHTCLPRLVDWSAGDAQAALNELNPTAARERPQRPGQG